MKPNPLVPTNPSRGHVERVDPADAGDPRLRAVRILAALMDDAVEIPGTGWRVGLDPVVGLVPGAGDLVAAVVSTWMILTAWRLGAPASVLARIVLNLGIDAVVGAIPLLGDAFDFAFKANRRNLLLIESWLERPAQTRRASILAVVGLLIVVVLVAAVTVWAAWTAFAWMVSALS